MHPAAYQFVAAVLRETGMPGSVVEIGSRDINGSVRPLFAGCTSYVGVDLLPGPGVDVVADARFWRPPGPVDMVVCCEVLEHTPFAGELVSAARRMLRPGGYLVITTACEPRAPHSGLDGGPLREGEHYRNITIGEMEHWLSGMSRFEVVAALAEGDLRAWGVE